MLHTNISLNSLIPSHFQTKHPILNREFHILNFGTGNICIYCYIRSKNKGGLPAITMNASPFSIISIPKFCCPLPRSIAPDMFGHPINPISFIPKESDIGEEKPKASASLPVNGVRAKGKSDMSTKIMTRS